MTEDLPGAITWHRYAQHRRVAAYELVGWIVEQRDLGPVHGNKTLMVYGKPSDTEPPEPASNAAVRRSIEKSRAHVRRSWSLKATRR